MPLPVEMPEPAKTGSTLTDPTAGGAKSPDAGDAQILREEQDAAVIPAADADLVPPASVNGGGLNSPLIPELSTPGIPELSTPGANQ